MTPEQALRILSRNMIAFDPLQRDRWALAWLRGTEVATDALAWLSGR